MNFTKRPVAFLLALLFCVAIPLAHAGENEIRKSLQGKFPGIGPLEHIVKTPYADLYEVILDDQLMYTDAKGQYLFEGNIYETATRRDLSKERRRVLFKIDFDKLPLNLALKKVKGNGKRKLALFTDPNCSFCRKLESELTQISNVTIYMFLYPAFPGSDEIIRNVLCAKDPYKSWQAWMLEGTSPARAICSTPQTQQIIVLAEKLRINGTPNLIFANGMQTPGFVSAEVLEASLNEK
jgi:thiol:disulfide interchange protein DsbC